MDNELKNEPHNSFHIGNEIDCPPTPNNTVDKQPSSTRVTVYLAGDSTVQTYKADTAPQAGWGQFIADCFTAEIQFANHAIGGRSSKTFVEEGRLDSILEKIKANDVLLIQMGHNDSTAIRPERYTEPYTTYKKYLKMYIDGARDHQAIPILITPMARLHFSEGTFINDFPDYCTAMKQVAVEKNVKVIDLMTSSLAYLGSIGYDEAYKLYMISANGTDCTHFTEKGAKEMARLVMEGVRELGIAISRYAQYQVNFEVPNGNYQVSLTLGDSDKSTETTVKSGPGRLMLENVQVDKGQFVEKSFAVHVDDGQLKLVISGSASKVRSAEVVETNGILTLFIAGDSTVTDQPSYPYAGWGQMISKFFNADVAVANYARSGKSSKSFIKEGLLELIWSRIRPGDYLLVQFAHNDEKENEGGTEPFTTYKQYLTDYINGARERGAFPVLVSPVQRRFFDGKGNIKHTHGDYIEAMRQLSHAEKVPFIDLAAKSKAFFEQLGEEGTKHIFMWTQPGEYANFPEGTDDNTHFQEYGAIAIAKLVAEGIREAGIVPLATYLR